MRTGEKKVSKNTTAVSKLDKMVDNTTTHILDQSK